MSTPWPNRTPHTSFDDHPPVRVVPPSLLARRDGFIAGFSSEPGKSGASPNAALYGAARSAVATFLRSLDGEHAGTTIRVAIAEALVFAATRGERGRMVEFPIYPAR